LRATAVPMGFCRKPSQRLFHQSTSRVQAAGDERKTLGRGIVKLGAAGGVADDDKDRTIARHRRAVIGARSGQRSSKRRGLRNGDENFGLRVEAVLIVAADDRKFIVVDYGRGVRAPLDIELAGADDLRVANRCID